MKCCGFFLCTFLASLVSTFLLQAMDEDNFMKLINSQDRDGNTALHQVILHCTGKHKSQYSHLFSVMASDKIFAKRMIRTMLQNGADIYEKNNAGLTPLELASKMTKEY